jgi:ABC-type multidrug transport system ATPase subunit
VEVARALLNRPDLLLLDEPTAGLDQSSRSTLVDHIRDISRNGATAVVWATHLPGEMEKADRVVTLDGGTIAGEHAPGLPLARLSAGVSVRN